MNKKTVDIKTDKLTQDILRFLREHRPHKYRVTSLVDVFFDTHSADSNHPKYRRVLRRVNWLYENGYLEAKYVNRYIAVRYGAK